MCAMVQRGFEMVGCGLAALWIEGASFKENVGAGTVKPLVYVREDFQMRALRPVAIEQHERI